MPHPPLSHPAVLHTGLRRTARVCAAHAPRRAHGACDPRAAANSIGDEGAKELAAALKTNTTLTTLDLSGACSDTSPSRGTADSHV